jgi:gliding motility-associated-like protein
MKRIALILILITLNFSLIAQIVINEVMHKPGTSSSVNQGLRKKEYVEIYNKGCSAIDISCWIIGSGAPLTGTTPYWVGAFQFPAGTIVNPGQHLVIGGTLSDNNTAYNPSDIDFDVNSPNTCQAGSGGWLLPNGDGWVAIYNSSGIVEDAIYWSVAQNPNINTDNDFSVSPCVPISTCSGITSLMSCREISQNYPSRISYVGLSTTIDKTFSRVPDGGSWSRDVNPSITGTNQCNNGQCSSAASFQLNASVTPPSCNLSNGSITFNVSPVGNYTYNWNPNSSNSNIATNLSSGSYSVSIGSGGCTKDTVISINAGNGPTSLVVNSVNPSCNLSNGSVNFGTVTGGIAPYQYNFNSLGYTTNTNYSGLSSGNYTVIVKDANGCEFTAPAIILSSVSGPSSVNLTTTNPSCGQANGSVAINFTSGGVAPYQYNFNSLGFSSNTMFSNLSSGNYSIIVKDANGCEYTMSAINLVNQSGPSSAILNTVNPSCGQSNGSITITSVTGGTLPYQYNLNAQGYLSSSNYLNLASGSYSVVIKDANGCIYNAPATVLANSNGPTSVNINSNNPTCNNTNGSVIISSVTGGVAPYQYNFNSLGFSNNSNYSNLGSGAYSLIIKDATGCIYNSPAIILAGSSAPTGFNYNNTPAYCNNADGSILISSVNGGTAPYLYNLNNQGYTNSNTFTDLSSGNYTISIIDNNNCTYTKTIVLTNSTITLNISSEINEPSCEGNDGKLKINAVNGGSAPYQYAFNDQVDVSVPVFENLAAGLYPLVVTDGDGCRTTFRIEIPKTDDNYVFYAPNTFTPNDDEVNDKWFVEGNCINEFKCYIYNRWGEIIAVLEDLNQKWDGTYKNVIVPDGVYIYAIYAVDFQNKSVVEYGQVSVIK